ncbi:helix-turn-helix transcriptional regulator [Brevundimonas diminuta]|uniref:helix-turn-helix domain-containing protein n=1 Tax=Brevundimonas diminuta TaxID=293 RepID=UPI0022AE8628|nr:helix-turn-helix transcriptional regulator [Brevundimonas diminuta]MCZ4109557.1 helix-turn-helix transcriptional regulator [Brevundimonas diminuta]
MARKPRSGRAELYETYREASGWYLAAWRDFRGLTLEELAAELGVSKGYLSDLETGAFRSGRNPTRFNRETLQAAAKALQTTGGRLIDVNPNEMDERADQIEIIFRDLDPASRDAVIQMAQTLSKRSA